jgi:hypothetical protein
MQHGLLDRHNLTGMRYLLVLLGEWAANAPLDAHDGVTALMLAARRDDAVALRFLLDQRAANPRLCDCAGHTALWYAMLRVDNHEQYAPPPRTARRLARAADRTARSRAHADEFPLAMATLQREAQPRRLSSHPHRARSLVAQIP